MISNSRYTRSVRDRNWLVATASRASRIFACRRARVVAGSSVVRPLPLWPRRTGKVCELRAAINRCRTQSERHEQRRIYQQMSPAGPRTCEIGRSAEHSSSASTRPARPRSASTKPISPARPAAICSTWSTSGTSSRCRGRLADFEAKWADAARPPRLLGRLAVPRAAPLRSRRSNRHDRRRPDSASASGQGRSLRRRRSRARSGSSTKA